MLTQFTIHPATVVGKAGTLVTGTLTLSGPAPASGLKVLLSSASPTVASVPTSVVVPGGRVSVSFTIRHFKVLQTQVVPLTAKFGGVTVSASLTVTP